MRDPVPPPPQFLFKLTKPFAEATGLITLPYHIHEVLFALILYQSIESVISPILSAVLFPNIYPKLRGRAKINWDVHVVSFAQSCLINVLALWVMVNDTERYDMKNSTVERIYGYTGASGLIQGLAAGYFVWDLIVSTRYIKIFGLGIWAHAITALCVYGFGFRPFCNYYGPVFILYELSSPFLNIHWFCDKLNMTGSKLQWYNGMLLLGTFFACRLVWGTYQSIRVYQDVWHILSQKPGMLWSQGHDVTNPAASIFAARDGQLCLGKESCIADQAEVMRFAGAGVSVVPLWLCAIYIVSNTTLNVLNFYWFGKMVETVRKRFQAPPDEGSKGEKQRRQSVVEEAATRLDYDVLSGPETPAVEKIEPAYVNRGLATSIDSGEVLKRR